MASLDELVGTRLGPYNVESELGQGGMAIVFLGRKDGDENPVALKVLSADFTADTRALERFHREAKTCASLDHPYIVKIYGIGEDRGFHFFAMEYLPHKSLHDLIRDEGKFEISQACDLVCKSLEGLEAAHAAGVIHRDLKPENIMMKGEGEPVLVDFGIAKSAKGARLTQTGVLLGTPYYMSPEQITGKEVTHQSDLYSMGVVLYELLTAEVPFQADSTFMITYKHCTEAPPPPRKLNEKISEALELVVLKALEKNLEKRYQTAKEFADDLRKVAAGGSVDFEVTRKRDIYSLPSFRAGMDAYKRSEYDEARESWHFVVEDIPDPEFAAEANRWIATSYFDQGDYLEAFRRYKSTADRWPGTEEAKRVPVYLDGCCFQQLQLGEKLLLRQGRAPALECFQDLLNALAEAEISQAEREESHWILLTEQRALEIAQEVRFRNQLKGLALAGVLAALASLAGLGIYFRFVNPFGGHLLRARWEGVKGNLPGMVSEYQRAINLQPKNVPTLVRLSEVLMTQGKTEEALVHLELVLGQLAPDDAKALELRADLYLAQGQGVEALQNYQRSLMAEDRAVEVWIKKGQAHEALGQPKMAEVAYIEAVKRDPEFADSYVALARNVWKYRKNAKKAIGLLDKALALDDKNAFAHYERGKILAANDRLKPAEEALQQAIWAQSDLVEAHYQLAILYARQKYRDKALFELEKAKGYAEAQGQATDKVNFLLGQMYEGIAADKSGQDAAELRDKAQAAYEAAARQAPDQADYVRRLGQFFFVQGAWEHAADAWSRWSTLAPNQAAPFYKLGQALLKSDRLGEAQAALARASRLAPQSADVVYHLGLAHFRSGELAPAADAYGRALALKPAFLPALLGATDLAVKRGDAPRCLQLATALGQAAPGDPAARTLAGRALLVAGDGPGARAQFEAAIQASARYVAALNELGLLELHSGDSSRGKTLLEDSLAVAPNQDRARELREALAQAKNSR